jgi:ATP-binding cassette, subfamily B, bacterial MsbA
MHHYRKILRFLLPYRRQIGLSIFFNILNVLFSLASITMLIPVLRIIFNSATIAVSTATTPLPHYNSIFELGAYVGAWLNYTITSEAQQIGQQAVLAKVLILAALLFVFKNAVRYGAELCMTYIKNGLERDLRAALHLKILELPLAYFADKRKGDITSRLTTDILEIQWALLSSVQRLVQDPLMILTTIVLLIAFSTKLTMFVIFLIPIVGFIVTSIGNTLKKPSMRAKQESGRLFSFIDEHLSGLAILKSYNAEELAQAKFEASNQRFFVAMNQTLFRRELSSPISEVLGTFVVLGIIWYGSFLILKNHELEPEVFITYILLFYQIINPAKSISTAVYDIKRGEASAQRMLEVLEAKNPLQDKPNALPKPTFDQKISFNNVRFQYEEKEVIRDFSLTIDKGKTIALVGQSGSGKSTLAYLLNRFYDVSDGSILLDGLDLRDLRQKDIRQHIGYISQEAVLFNDSIKNNLLYGNPNASDEQVMEAARIANAHDFILATEQGYETNIGDRGAKLSGGQRQRLTIARAILKNPAILVLDEATSALDSESERLVQDALQKLMQNRTAIVIAHRLSTIQHADEIIVLREGKIVERGTHNDLIYKTQGEYQKLVALQAL